MKYLSLTILIALMCMTACQAQTEDSHTAAVNELLSIMDMEAMLSETINASLDMQIQQNPALAQYREVMLEFFDKYMSWETLKDDFIKIYKAEFTEKEIRDLIAFYKTDTGKKAMQKIPVLFQKGAAVGQKRVQDNIHILERMIRDYAE